jgi:hypothetical protein
MYSVMVFRSHTDNYQTLPSQQERETALRIYASQYLTQKVWSVELTSDTAAQVSGDRVRDSTIELSMVRFIVNDLPGLRVPTLQPQDASYSPLKSFMSLNAFTTPLTVGPMITPFLVCGHNQVDINKLAVNVDKRALKTMRILGGLRNEVAVSSSFRHHMTSAVAGAMLTSCALLLYDFDHHRNAHVGCFIDSVSLLRDLARTLPYARRVHEDCARLVDAINRWIEQHDVPLECRPTDLSPLDIAPLFPYQTFNLPLEDRLVRRDALLELVEASKMSSVLWLL